MVPKIFLNYNTEFKQKAPEIAAEAAIERAIEAAKSEEVKKVAVEKTRVEKEGVVNKVATKSAAPKGAEAAIVAEQVVSADDAVPVEAHGANVGQPRHRLSASGPCVPEGNALLDSTTTGGATGSDLRQPRRYHHRRCVRILGARPKASGVPAIVALCRSSLSFTLFFA